jgi:hypothetical protein
MALAVLSPTIPFAHQIVRSLEGNDRAFRRRAELTVSAPLSAGIAQ